MSLKDKNAIVTGGSRGIGAQIALDLAKEGANVLINYTSPSSTSKAKEIVAQIEKLGNGAKAGIVQADVGAKDMGEKIVGEAKRFFEEDKIDILIHNAGVCVNHPLEEVTAEDFEFQFNINVRGPMLLTKAALPYIPKGGRIVLVSSVSARSGFPTQTVYGATKAAVESFVKCWHNEFGLERGITINAVNPGPVETDMFSSTKPEFQTELRKKPIAMPSEISDVVIFLVSDKARWVSGSVVSTNGGILLF